MRARTALRESVGERAKPDLEAGVGGVRGRKLQSVSVAAGDANRIAVQVVADDAHLAPHDLRVERLACAHAGAEKAGVVGNAFAEHTRSVPYLSCPGSRAGHFPGAEVFSAFFTRCPRPDRTSRG